MMQPEEEDSDSTDIFGPDPGRYITEEIDDAGDEDEIVRFRTFVNAEIGLRRHRVKSAGAPYLLCLSSKDGVSEPRVTLCNQGCTMELARDFTVDDLQKPKVSTSHIATVATMNTQPPYPLDFGNMKTTIAFTNEVDLYKFMNIPKRYFDAVRCREPRILPNATETILFKRPVELYERLRADTMKSIGSQQNKKKSCDLRVLETTSREGWKTVRRLVVSSSFEEEIPWSTDYFLPLSRVQVKRNEEVPRRADVKWSDCSHEVIGTGFCVCCRVDKNANRHLGTDGYYNETYNYIYNEQNPNIAISVYFRNTADAAEFESKILTLSVPPIYPAVSPLISTLPVGASEKVIYDVSDSGPDNQNLQSHPHHPHPARLALWRTLLRLPQPGLHLRARPPQNPFPLCDKHNLHLQLLRRQNPPPITQRPRSILPLRTTQRDLHRRLRRPSPPNVIHVRPPPRLDPPLLPPRPLPQHPGALPLFPTTLLQKGPHGDPTLAKGKHARTPSDGSMGGHHRRQMADLVARQISSRVPSREQQSDPRPTCISTG